MDKLMLARLIKKMNTAMWLGMIIVIGLAILLDDKTYSVVAALILIYYRLQTMYINMLLVSDWLDRFKPELKREFDTY